MEGKPNPTVICYLFEFFLPRDTTAKNVCETPVYCRYFGVMYPSIRDNTAKQPA